MGSRITAIIFSLVWAIGPAVAESNTGSTEKSELPVADSKYACEDNTIWLRGSFGVARFGIEVADSQEERAQGLMNVPYMPAGRGMLFVYEHPQKVAFWMKNTLIPLDMVFADENGRVVKVHSNAIPGDLTAIPGEGQVQYVLEINGGLAEQMGIKTGAHLRHSAISSPIWPCEAN
jgi:uncharacterized membrane protein (UPF0127 family)